MRKKRMRKNKSIIKKVAFILGVLMCGTAFTTSLISEFNVYANNNIKTSENFGEANGIKYLKTAKPTDKEGEYEITLQVKGTPTTETVPVDVLMIMDTSGSMRSDIISLQTAMKNFTTNILTNVNDSRISVVEFANEEGIGKSNSNLSDEPYNDVLEDGNKEEINNKSKEENLDNVEKPNNKNDKEENKSEINNEENNKEEISDDEKTNNEINKEELNKDENKKENTSDSNKEESLEKQNENIQNIKLYSSPKIKSSSTTTSNKKIEPRGSINDAKVLHDFSSNAKSINDAIGKTTAGGGTNAEAAWLLANKQLDSIDKNRKSNKYVIFFTDGLPNRTVNGGNAISKAEEAYNATKSTINGLKAYSVGLIANIDDDDKGKARRFLQNTQSHGRFLIEDKNGPINLDKIYETIANNIKNDTAMASNTVITDEVTKEFDIIPGSTIQVIKPLENGKQEILDVEPIISGNKISFNLGDVGTEGRIIKFRIKLKEEYYGLGDEKIPTNVKATMNYKDKNNKDKEIIFQVPEVNVPYKKGSITVEKVVNELQGLTAPKDDNFNISLNGISNNYAFNLMSGESKKMNFTLKHKDAKVSDENLSKQDFLNIGEYNIKEIVPMNYEIQSITVNDENVTDNPKFIINNTVRDIKIKVTNKYVNDNYFYDKDEEKNVLQVSK